jgi:hypothetical protein
MYARAVGNLIPLVEHARRLDPATNVVVTIVMITGLFDPATNAAVLSTLSPSVTTTALLAVTLDDLPADLGFGAIMFELVPRSLPHLRKLIVTSRGPRSCATSLAPQSRSGRTSFFFLVLLQVLPLFEV